jgi:hypothetical protein
MMIGRRTRELLREEMDRRFYRLGQFFGCYLHEDWPELHGTPEKAVEKAIEDYPVDILQQVRRELRDVLSDTAEDEELRDVLNWGLGVNVHFKKPEEARTFAEAVETQLMRSIKKHFAKGGRQG